MIMIVSLFALLLPACGASETEETPAAPLRPQEIVEMKATEAIEALKMRDMDALAQLVHPVNGVRFTPYSFVSEDDLSFTAAQVATLMGDPTVYQWGAYDGTGDPIEGTFEAYYEQFVYDQDFANAEQISIDEPLGSGNSINNSSEFYSNSIIVEYHFSGFNPDYAGMDWRSLRLVFQETADQEWALVGIIHAEWTI